MHVVTISHLVALSVIIDSLTWSLPHLVTPFDVFDGNLTKQYSYRLLLAGKPDYAPDACQLSLISLTSQHSLNMSDGPYRPQTKVDWTSNNAFSQFKLWKKEVERILNGPLAARSDLVKVNHIYIWAGAYAETLIEARTNKNPQLQVNTPTVLLEQLEACLTHSTLFREARESFYSLKQAPGENVTLYYTRVMDLFSQSQFPKDSDFLVADKLIHGCTNEECKRKLMIKEKDVTVKQCLDVMRQHEAVDVTMKRLEGASIDAAYAYDPTKQSQKKGFKRKQYSSKAKTSDDRSTAKPCIWCKGNYHPRDKCPARNAKCQFCSKDEHFEKACLANKRQIQGQKQGGAKLKKTRAVTVTTDPESSDCEYGGYDLQSVSINSVHNSPQPREVLSEVEFHTARPTTLQGKVDTGAMVSCIPLSMLPNIGFSKEHLNASKSKLRSVSGATLENCGTISCTVTCNNITDSVTLYVTGTGTELILGLGFCKQFQLVNLADSCIQREVIVDSDSLQAVHITHESETDYKSLQQKWSKYLPLGKETGDPLEDLKQIFPTMFDGTVGLFQGETQLKLSPDAKPVQLPPRAVPQSILPKLKMELDKMEKEGIIRPCPETTDWVHNLVIVVKKNGELRLCLDPRNLNKYLIRNVHYTASWEDVQHSFHNGKYFSTLDAKSGYWTQLLSQESQILTAFNTPFKKYCFVRLPFGLSASSEIFCAHMDQALSGIPGTFPCADDVKVQGSTEERHDLPLLETVARAQTAGLKFNPEKCVIKKQQIEYIGKGLGHRRDRSISKGVG